MTTTTAPAATYRKTKTGEWVAYGRLADFLGCLSATGHTEQVFVSGQGIAIPVTKKSGEVKYEQVVRLGRSFVVDGVEMVYGYIAKSTPRTYTATPDCGHRHPAAGCFECSHQIGL